MAIVRDIIIFIFSIGIGFVFTYFIAETNSNIASSSIPFFLWGLFTVISALSLRSLFSGGVKIGRRSAWGPPEQDRDRVISTPQFVGRLDRKRGLLESTARMVMGDLVTQSSFWNSQGTDYTVIRLRGELLDQNGSPLEYIPVEIRAKRQDFIGVIVDGDRIRVEGKIESDGIFHTDRAFNYSTNSWVGSPR
jgi:hypothetical protein